MPQICPGRGIPGLVSVIIPSYNRAYIIAHTIESVLAQTYPDVEIIIVDDGSTDDTREVVARYGDRVHYIYQPNAGCPAARNTGLAVARGEFIALLDSDDQWYPWKLELQIAFLRKHPDVGMVWTDMAAISEDGSRISDAYLRTFYKAYSSVRVEDMMVLTGTIGELGVSVPDELATRPCWSGDIFSEMIRGSLVHTPTTVLRREFAAGTGGYDESLKPAGEDFDFHLRTAAQGKVAFLDVSAIDYRIGHSDQITAPHYDLAFARNYLKTVKHWLQHEGHRITLPAAEIRGVMAYAHHWIGSQELFAGNHIAARHHLWESIRHGLMHPQIFVLLMFAALPPTVLIAVRRAQRRMRNKQVSLAL